MIDTDISYSITVLSHIENNLAKLIPEPGEQSQSDTATVHIPLHLARIIRIF